MVFVAEQDGIPERELKAKLVEHFVRNRSLESAFLVRVQYGNSEELKVALCLNVRRDVSLARCAAAEFKQMFGSHESLDILFLNRSQLQQIQRAAKPFYTRNPSESNL